MYLFHNGSICCVVYSEPPIDGENQGRPPVNKQKKGGDFSPPLDTDSIALNRQYCLLPLMHY